MNPFKVGDIVTAYRKGYHEVIEVTKDYIKYRVRFKSNGDPLTTAEVFSCHMDHVTLAKSVIKYEIEKQEAVLKSLKKLSTQL